MMFPLPSDTTANLSQEQEKCSTNQQINTRKTKHTINIQKETFNVFQDGFFLKSLTFTSCHIWMSNKNKYFSVLDGVQINNQMLSDQ